MEELTWRLLPYRVADGPTNMAIDEALLRAAAAGGVATLRFYGWSQPTLSLGYFQKESVRHGDPLLAALPFVRRPTGGDTLVHHHELTYALAVPPGVGHGSQAWPRLMHEIIAAALATLGVESHLFELQGPSQFEGPLCFHHATPDDLMIGHAKVVGSAQRKQRGALLQHGGILLARSPHTPTLPGIRELAGRLLTAEELQIAVVKRFASTVATLCISDDWTDIQQEVERLERTKYWSQDWNSKR